jgi:hypothetical protein
MKKLVSDSSCIELGGQVSVNAHAQSAAAARNRALAF